MKYSCPTCCFKAPLDVFDDSDPEEEAEFGESNDITCPECGDVFDEYQLIEHS